jgi:uncharacterized OB-fold protein
MSQPGYWREMAQRYRLEAACCKECGTVHFPPRMVCSCPDCGCVEFETIKLPETGKVITYTIIRVPASQYSDQAPFAVGIIEFDRGARALMQIVDVPIEQVKVDMPVRIAFRKLFSDGEAGIIKYGYKAVPA